MSTAPSVRKFSSTETLARALAASIHEIARAAIAQRGHFHLALSGGSIPTILSQPTFTLAKGVDYHLWHVWLADERCVLSADKDSNALAIREALMAKTADGFSRVHLHTADERLLSSPAAMAASYEKQIRASFCSPAYDATPRLDCVLLGLGADGHTCSLFPLADSYARIRDSDSLVEAVADSPKPPSSRITLTPKFVARARTIMFVATGKAKAEAIKKSICDGDGSLPPAHIMQLHGEPACWFIDKEGASTL